MTNGETAAAPTPPSRSAHRPGRFGRWFDRWFGSTDPLSEPSDGLTQQFVRTLRAMFEDTSDGTASHPRNQRIRELLELDDPSWQDAYEAEQLLAHELGIDVVKVEVGRRLVEAERTLHPDTAAYYRKYTTTAADGTPAAALPSDEKELRALYGRLLNDLQWRYTIKERKHGLYRETSRNTILGFVVVLGLVVVVAAVSALGADSGLLSVDPVAATLAGLLGAGFSMLVGLRNARDSGLDDLKVTSRPGYTMSRLCIGICAGLVMCVALQTGFVQGGAFPALDDGMSVERATRVAKLARAEVENTLLKPPVPEQPVPEQPTPPPTEGAPDDATGSRSTTKPVEAAAPKLAPAALAAAMTKLEAGWVERLQLPIGQRATCALEFVDQADALLPLADVERDPLQGRLARLFDLGDDRDSRLALLLLWAFLAGFSERLVPNLLNRRAQEAGGDADAAKPKPAA